MATKSKHKRGTFIHGIGASEHLDSSGERIKIRGVDISSLTKDGVFNWEHKSEASIQIVGKILEAKKIYKRSDCENDHHRYFWDKCKMPFLYIAGELFDAVDHSGAKDLVAMLKYDAQGHEKKGAKDLVNFSIEGARLEKRGSEITKCIARKITVTITPCNKVAGAEIKEDLEKNSSLGAGAGFSVGAESIGLASDIMMEKSEILMKDNWGEMGMGATIKNENPASFKPKRVFTPKNAPQNMKVGDRIDYKTPMLPEGSSQTKYGKVIVKNKEVKKGKIGEAIKEMTGKLQTDATASRVQREREKAGKPFDPDKKIVATPKKTLVGKNMEKGAKDLFHIHADGNRISSKPQSLDRIKETHGDVRSIERQGFKLVPHKEDATPKKKKLGKYESNMRKAIAAGMGIGGAGTQTQGAALQREEMVKSDEYKPKRGDLVRLHTGASDYHTGKKFVGDKKYVVHGESKRGTKSHWVVPEGEKDSKKGFYHRSDRLHHPDDSKVIVKSELNKSDIRKVMKSLADDAFDRFEKKEELISFLSQKLPNNCEKEILAIAKAVTYVREKKQEVKLAALVDEKDV